MLTNNNERYLVLFSMSLGAAFSDLLMKYLFRSGMIEIAEGSGPGFLQIVYHENHGMLGNLPVPSSVIIVLTIVALGILIYTIMEAIKHKHDPELLFLSLVLGGALGNFIDRLVYGHVFDWLMIFNTSIINIADTFITVGLVGYVAVYWLRRKHEPTVEGLESEVGSRQSEVE